MLFKGRYQGSSFFEMLQTDQPHLLPDYSAVREGVVQIPHGTTVLAFKYNEGVLVAGDRLATAGNLVASRDVQKVFTTDSHSLMAISGAAGPCIEMARILGVELEHYEKMEGEALELEGKANKLSQMIRQNLPAAMQGLVVVPLYAGYDLRRNIGRMWKFDITGGRYEELDLDATGSGGLFARESLKKVWNADLSREDAVRAAVTALTDAAEEDTATGGVDLQRGIFPHVKLCTESGIEQQSEDVIETIFRELKDTRSEPSGASSGATGREVA